MTKAQCKRLAIKYYKRNLAQRKAIDSLPMPQRIESQRRLYLLTMRLHQVFDSIEAQHGKHWTDNLYKIASDKALGLYR